MAVGMRAWHRANLEAAKLIRSMWMEYRREKGSVNEGTRRRARTLLTPDWIRGVAREKVGREVWSL